MPAHRRTHRLVGVALVVTALWGVAGCSAPVAATPSASRVTALPADAAVLFVARAAHGDLAPFGDTATLTLEGLVDVSWFTDRPTRKAGMTSLADALTALGWNATDGSLGPDAPNAELTADELGADSLALELQSATVDGSTVTLTVAAIGGAPIPTTALTSLELFIDDSDYPQQFALSPHSTATTVVTGDTATVTIAEGPFLLFEATLSPESADATIDAGPDVTGSLQLQSGTSGQQSTVTGTFQVTDDGQHYSYSGIIAAWQAP